MTGNAISPEVKAKKKHVSLVEPNSNGGMRMHATA